MDQSEIDRGRVVRVPTDVAEMLTAIAEHECVRVLDIVDPLIRDAVEQRFASVPQWMRDRYAERMARLAGRATTPP